MSTRRASLAAACAAALLALPAAANAQAPSNCATSGPTGDPVNDCVKALGGVDLGPFEHFIAEWAGPRITTLTLPTVPPAVCQMRSEQHITLPAVSGLAVFACNNEVPSSLTVSIVNDNGVLTPTGTYYYYETTGSCTGERTCQLENLIGGSSGAIYRTEARFTITAPGLSISAQPYCQRRSPGTTECFTSDTLLALAR